MADKLKCPYCGSENVKRMDGSGAVKKYGPGVMIDIAPDIFLCNDCKKEFRDDLFDDLTMDEALLEQKGE